MSSSCVSPIFSIRSLSIADLQFILAVVVKAYSRMGLSVNTTKTEVICQWSSSTPHTLPVFTIDNTPPAITQSFKYLGKILSEDCSIDSEIQNQIKLTSAAFAAKHGPHTADTSRPWSASILDASSGSWASPGVIIVLYCQLHHGQRLAGGPKKRYKDQLKTSLKKSKIRPEDLETAAADRDAWRQHCYEGTQRLEEDRTARRHQKRLRGNTPTPMTASIITTTT
ncbi:LOW QUALITY PROTEIN: uncharacterized protein LOC117545945 [Xyrichtys novacula]|uniref:LOW QUALITY PROTEIN: uncharacterized protein LOC117545945 n=1 Tax=Xyrichtys novacula TaxID=13765 RepID=A0AAV1GBG8_XYRNO|nr:LOW QUALITY PROTEIN: uncharacterized protein LOC117545945 [Xyrichtys novacula]